MSHSNIMDKKDICVPEWVGKRVEEDTESFEFYKKDGNLNKNLFLRHLVVGYYYDYLNNNKKKINDISDILLNNNVPEESINEISESILKSVVLPPVPTRKGKNPKKLSLKPSKDMATLMLTIERNLGPSDSLSQYLCRMIMSYCELPFSEREKIIFSDLFSEIERYCASNNKTGTVISIRTIWKPDIIHNVIPYKITTAKDERYNYLLCAEITNGKQEARAYRINRIIDIEESGSSLISDEIRKNLDRMLIDGANFRIKNDDENAIVRLTQDGILSYKRIYNGRPKPYRICDNGETCDYYFDGSNEQLFLYFRRFGSDAEIISPKSLRERMHRFYSDGAALYDNGEDN